MQSSAFEARRQCAVALEAARAGGNSVIIAQAQAAYDAADTAVTVACRVVSGTADAVDQMVEAYASETTARIELAEALASGDEARIETARKVLATRREAVADTTATIETLQAVSEDVCTAQTNLTTAETLLITARRNLAAGTGSAEDVMKVEATTMELRAALSSVDDIAMGVATVVCAEMNLGQRRASLVGDGESKIDGDAVSGLTAEVVATMLVSKGLGASTRVRHTTRKALAESKARLVIAVASGDTDAIALAEAEVESLVLDVASADACVSAMAKVGSVQSSAFEARRQCAVALEEARADGDDAVIARTQEAFDATDMAIKVASHVVSGTADAVDQMVDAYASETAARTELAEALKSVDKARIDNARDGLDRRTVDVRRCRGDLVELERLSHDVVVAEKKFAGAQLEYDDVRRRNKEGIANEDEVLEAETDLDKHRVTLTAARRAALGEGMEEVEVVVSKATLTLDIDFDVVMENKQSFEDGFRCVTLAQCG